MTLADEEKKSLIIYRLRQADEAADSAELLLANYKTAAAINRIYYAVFYCVMALALKSGFNTSKHLQLIGWFNKTYIRTGLIDQEFGRILKDCYEYRKKADYDSFVEFERIDVNLLLNEMKKFLSNIKNYIEIT
ncbi:HEPN domain-containing protein [Draconibacterium sp.]|jgi:uncharacterized protein (UPF0332 family)